ncbi:hypothetical protein SK128_003502 [Halocaridina rubra]|uniref:Uncharacterized protein n=1 Tax=Halocaridina rubra TaxID=373956 RepID=A0AAN8WVQ8_HALRR
MPNDSTTKENLENTGNVCLDDEPHPARYIIRGHDVEEIWQTHHCASSSDSHTQLYRGLGTNIHKSTNVKLPVSPAKITVTRTNRLELKEVISSDENSADGKRS